MARWQPGTVVVHEAVYAGHLITAIPVTVVRDAADELVLYSAAGSTRVDGTMRDRRSMRLADRMAVYLDPDPQPLEERPVRAHVLALNVPGAFHSVLLFWTPAWQFLHWYVNLERPPVRTARGVEYRRDLFLDLVVAPDLSWSWKDRDEFDAACAAGLLDERERELALAEAEQVIERVEAREGPFDEPWPEWRPDPAWPVPHLRLAGQRSWRFAPAVEPGER